jgi:arylsulfatase
MAAYAAMIDRMDQSIGRLVAALKRLGQYEDTLILFLSDNGGCAEFMAEDGWAKFFPDETLDGRKITMGNVPDLRPGDVLTYQSYDKPWANVSNAPFRLFKHYVHEGGISTPLIAHWPNRIAGGLVAHEPCHVVDVLPTILAATGSSYLSELGGHAIQPLQGESFLDLLVGDDWRREQPIFFEHEGNCAIRKDNFKLVRQYGSDWELYDMDADRTELHDLAGRHAPLQAGLLSEYQDWAEKSGVLDWDLALPRLLEAWKLSSTEG